MSEPLGEPPDPVFPGLGQFWRAQGRARTALGWGIEDNQGGAGGSAGEDNPEGRLSQDHLKSCPY